MSDTLWQVMEATWPAARCLVAGPWIVREGKGGGQRVSAITAAADWADADIPTAEAAARALSQAPVFMIRSGEDRLDAALSARGYVVKDPVLTLVADVAQIPDPGHSFSCFPHWPPLAVTCDIWLAHGIGAGRQAVMVRAAGPKAALLGRIQDRPAAAGFVAVADGIAMLHALDVVDAFRRQGLGRDMVRGAARWAREAGARRLALQVTAANQPACALYEGMGFTPAAAYHYRVLP